MDRGEAPTNDGNGEPDMTAQDTRITQYLAGRQAFAILTGEIDKEAQKVALADGYKALASLAADKTIREIVSASGLSKGKVERDVRAAKVIATYPDIDPLLVVRACNAGTAAHVAKATADPARAKAQLASIVRDANAKRREANGSTLDQVEKADAKPGKETKAPKAPSRTATAEDVVAFLMAAPFSSAEFGKIENAARIMRQGKEKAEASVKTA